MSTPPARPEPAYPVYELTVEAVRELDRRAVSDFGVPGVVLMENAGVALREQALAMLAEARSGEAVIVCGPGNNGGDGFVLARHLINRGVGVRVVLAGDPGRVRGDAATNLEILRRMGVAVEPVAPPLGAGLVVDALFGTGLDRAITGDAAGLVAWINDARRKGDRVLAVDVPSGLDATTGLPLGEACVAADRTVTLAGVKPGLTRLEAQPFVGELVVGDIGAPVALLRELGRPQGGSAGGGLPPDPREGG